MYVNIYAKLQNFIQLFSYAILSAIRAYLVNFYVSLENAKICDISITQALILRINNINYVLNNPSLIPNRVVSVLDSGAEGPGFKSQPQRCRVTVLGKLFTPIVPLFTKQRNWQQLS